jgi:hypothetical protein
MPRSSLDQRKRNLRLRKNTQSKREFANMRTWFPDRVTIVSEGDSWFAYPAKWLVGKPPNLVSRISGWSRGKANFYTMASNGDEAVDMVSGKQKHQLIDILRWHEKAQKRKPVDLLLFSGGGNDIVGSNDFERFIRPYQSGYTPRECLRIRRLKRKIKQIGLAYQELLDIRDHYSPSTQIMTHTYDYPFASLQGANFLGGLIKTKGWMKRFMDEIGIPDELQTQVIREFMDMMAMESLNIADKRTGFVVIDTRGTLLDNSDWVNEIHPDRDGFKAIADKIYVEIEHRFPLLARS